MFGANRKRRLRRLKAPRRGKLRIGVCTLLAIAPLACVRSARASHPPPKHEVQQIVIDRTEGRAVALGLRFGGYVLNKDERGWSSVCSAALGSDDTETYPGVSLADGSLVVSTGLAGIARSSDGCGWSTWHPDFPAFFVDLRVDEADSSGLFALSSTADAGGFATQLWRSTDGGESWLAHGNPLPPDLAATSLAVSQRSSSRLYVAGSGANGAELLRSDDAGASWNRAVIEHAGVPRLIGAETDQGSGSEVVAILLEAHQHTEQGSALTDSIHVSFDAGEHFRSLYESADDLGAAALSNSGQLAFGGSDGLFVADVARRGASERRELAPGTSVQSLAWAGARLYAGIGDPNGALSLIESDDQGLTFSRVVSLCDVSPALDCGGESTVGATCSGDTEPQVSLAGKALPWCAAAPPAPPQSIPAPGGAPAEGSSCALKPARGTSDELFALLALLSLAIAVSRRRAAD
jgi:photosystem II stability/assembly factor-like uncharacterized protein